MGKIVFSTPTWTTSDTTVKYSPVTAREPSPASVETAVIAPTATAAPQAQLPRPPFWATKANR